MKTFLEQVKEQNYNLFMKGFSLGVITALIIWVYFDILQSIF